MALRLKKQHNVLEWIVYNNIEIGYIICEKNECNFYDNKDNSHKLTAWNHANKYQTEYRKMRAALIHFLEFDSCDWQKGNKCEEFTSWCEYRHGDYCRAPNIKPEDRITKEDCADAAHEERQRAMRLEDEIKVLQFQVKSYKSLLESMGYNPSEKTVKQAAMLAEYQRAQYANGHYQKPQAKEFEGVVPPFKGMKF